jgi:hypothetical protein
MVLSLSKEYLDKNLTFFLWFVRYVRHIPAFFVAEHYNLRITGGLRISPQNAATEGYLLQRQHIIFPWTNQS